MLTERDAEDYRACLGGQRPGRAGAERRPATGHLSQPGDAKVVVAAGRLARQKGFDLLVDAYAQVAHRYPRLAAAHLRVGPEERGRLLAQILRLGLERQVRLMGYTDDAARRRCRRRRCTS